MKTIRLTNGSETLVDDEDYEELACYKWFASSRNKKQYYALMRNPATGENERMHRVILHAKCGKIVDHKNGNTLDNRRCNLRFADACQNSWNARRIGGSSKYKGVSWNKERKRWKTCIAFRGKQNCLGKFKNEDDAGLMYYVASQILHGEYSVFHRKTL